ncbi:MAG: ATP-binding protein [Lachnospiraceae bacterium]
MAERKVEQSKLEKWYQQKGNQLFVLYGREENGIRELSQDFCKDKKTFYYHAPEVSGDAQKLRMKKELENNYQITIEQEDYEAYFSSMVEETGHKLVLVIDEFDYIVKKDDSFMTAVKKLKEKKLYQGDIMILLCSTSVSWVEQDMTRILGPIGKELNGIIKLKELKFIDVVKFFSNYSVSQCVELYGVIGGVPEFMEHWNKEKDIRWNICHGILSKNGFLFHKAEWMIRSQLREPSVYHTILEAVASGKHKLNDLYQETGFSRAKISVYLKNLMELDLIEKIYSMETGGWENSQKGLYQIKDTFINFWFTFIYPHLSQLYQMEPEDFYDAYLADKMGMYLNRYFVKICMEYLELMDLTQKLPVQIHKMGTWIGKKGHIDIIVQNSIRENLICLCNWSEPKMTFEMCQQLFESMEQAKISASYYYLFSAKGFDEKLIKMVAKDSRILLVNMNQL